MKRDFDFGITSGRKYHFFVAILRLCGCVPIMRPQLATGSFDNFDRSCIIDVSIIQ